MAVQVAIVTGCNSGVGLYISVALARSHRVYAGIRSVTAEKRADLDAAATEAGVTAEIRVFELDVASDDSVRTNIAAVLAEAGRVDVLVNNAGFSLFGTVEFLEMDKIRGQFETNVYGVIRCQQAVLPLMRAQRSGKIINVTSVGGIWGQPFNDVYCASKFAVEGLSESQAALFRTFGIHVTCVEPGLILTKFVQNAQRPDLSTVPEDYQDPLGKTLAAYTHPEGRKSGQTGEEVAQVIIDQVVNVAEPPLRVQTNPLLRSIFEAQLRDPTGEAGVKLAQARFFPSALTTAQ